MRKMANFPVISYLHGSICRFCSLDERLVFCHMIRIYHWSLLLLGILPFLPSCQNAKDEDVVIVTTAPEFQVDLFEQRDAVDGHPEFGLWIQSLEKYPCNNYVIEYSVQMTDGKIEVHLNDVTSPDTCHGSVASARAFIPIGNLSPGTYPFALALGNAINNEGTLSVFEDRYEMSLPSPQGIDFQNLVVRKMKPGLLWGHIATPDAATSGRAIDFLNELKSITSEPALAPGYYSYFTVSGTGLIVPHTASAPGGPTQFFLRKLEGAPAPLQNLLLQYRNAQQNALQITCLSTFGAF